MITSYSSLNRQYNCFIQHLALHRMLEITSSQDAATAHATYRKVCSLSWVQLPRPSMAHPSAAFELAKTYCWCRGWTFKRHWSLCAAGNAAVLSSQQKGLLQLVPCQVLGECFYKTSWFIPFCPFYKIQPVNDLEHFLDSKFESFPVSFGYLGIVG